MKFLFELYKDKVLKNSSEFKKEITNNYNITKEQAYELYVKITNYQINKYGQTLDNICEINSLNSKIIINAKERRHSKRRTMQGRGK